MTLRKANSSDFSGILELQKRNLLQNIDPRARQEGFLSIEYSADQLAVLNRGSGIFVALEDDQLAGYLMTQTMGLAVQSRLITIMVNRFPDIQYRGRPLSSFRTLIYGPVCIDKKSRGRGILQGLFGIMRRTLKVQYDMGVAFVSGENPRSLYAHRDKLGMKVVDEFEANGQRYHTLVFDF